MRLSLTVFFVATLSGSIAVCVGQTSASSSAATERAPATAPSALLQPALGTLQQALGTLQPDKWKVSGAIREEIDADVGSIRRDLESTLPPLLTAADTAQDSVSGILPASRNIDALYDVLLRVAERARLAAPQEQSAALERAMENLEHARSALGERLQGTALAQEKQMRDLQAALRAQPAPAAPAPVVVAAPPPCPPPSRPKPKSKPQAKPAIKPNPMPAKPSSSPQPGL
jgi:hypothetical protein